MAYISILVPAFQTKETDDIEIVNYFLSRFFLLYRKKYVQCNLIELAMISI